MKRLFKFKYPKIALWIIFIIAAYFIFSNSSIQNFFNSNQNNGFLYVLIFGALFTFGFTTPFAIGFFITYNPSNIFLAAIIGGLGAVVFDLTIFKFIKFTFMSEFKRLKKEKEIVRLSNLIHIKLSDKIKIYLTYVFAGIIIASPLPDEIGVSMLAGLTKIKTLPLAILSFIFNSLGILVMMLL
jgi:hypothetical protein